MNKCKEQKLTFIEPHFYIENLTKYHMLVYIVTMRYVFFQLTEEKSENFGLIMVLSS